jgi:hypothetical protein
MNLILEKNNMAKTRKRREQKKYTPQTARLKTSSGSTSATATSSKKRKINWVQIAAITIGILVVISMILALFVVPGTGIIF